MNASEIKQFFDRLKSARQSSHDEDWSTIQRYLDPQSHGFYENNNTDGNVNRSLIFDSAPERAKDDLNSALLSMVVDPRRKYINFEAIGADYTLEEKEFFQAAEDYVLSVFSTADSNFFGATASVLDECPLYGQAYATMFKTPEDKLVKFSAIPVQEGYILRNEYKKPTMFFRLIKMTARQIINQYKDAAGSELLAGDWDSYKVESVMNPSREFDIVYGIIPTDDALITNGSKMKYTAVTVDYTKCKFLKIGGFEEFPLLAPPWHLKASEDYGRGVGHRAIADVAVLNLMVKDNLAAAEIILMPPIALPFGLTIDNDVNLSARAINYLDFNASSFSGAQNDIRPINVIKELPIGLEMEDRRREGVRQAFFADLLQELKSDRMTAQESSGREMSRIQRLTAPLFLFEQHYLAPAAMFVLQAGIDYKVLKVPESLKNKKIRPVFTSALVDAMKLVKLAQLERALQSYGNTAGLPPVSQDALNMSDLAEEIFDLAGANISIVRDREEADARTKQREDAAVNAQNAQSVAQLGSGLESLSNAAQTTRTL